MRRQQSARFGRMRRPSNAAVRAATLRKRLAEIRKVVKKA